jgi:uncharacterized membrane-anchored protein
MISTESSMPLDTALKLARMKIIFGFLLLLSLIALAAVIALKSVTEAESYGLMPIVTALATLAGGFSNWAFGQHSVQVHEPGKEDEGPKEIST